MCVLVLSVPEEWGAPWGLILRHLLEYANMVCAGRWLAGPLPFVMNAIWTCLQPGSLGRALHSFMGMGSGFLLRKELRTQPTPPRRLVAQIEVLLVLLLILFQIPFMEAVLLRNHFSLMLKHFRWFVGSALLQPVQPGSFLQLGAGGLPGPAQWPQPHEAASGRISATWYPVSASLKNEGLFSSVLTPPHNSVSWFYLL